MSADNYYRICRHPKGGFAAVMGFMSSKLDGHEAEPRVTDPRYATVAEAIAVANRETFLEYGIQIDPDLMGDDGTELTGDDIPYHLRESAPPLGQCDRCGRKTWSRNQVGAKDPMPQPDGNPCGGCFIAKGEPDLHWIGPNPWDFEYNPAVGQKVVFVDLNGRSLTGTITAFNEDYEESGELRLSVKPDPSAGA